MMATRLTTSSHLAKAIQLYLAVFTEIALAVPSLSRKKLAQLEQDAADASRDACVDPEDVASLAAKQYADRYPDGAARLRALSRKQASAS